MLTQDLMHPQAERLLAQAMAAIPPRLDLAAVAVAALEYPLIDATDTEARLDFFASRVRVHRRDGWTPSQQIAALRKVLVEEEGFRGNSTHYSEPENSFINVVMVRKVGLPITLGLIWLEVARRADIPLFGIAFPGHFLVAYRVEGGRIVVDPFNEGRTLSRDDCAGMLRKFAPQMSLSDSVFAPATPRAIAWRMLTNLKKVYIGRGDQARAVRVENLLLQLAPNHPGELRTRAALLSSLGAYRAALQDLEKAIEVAPAPDAPILQEAANLLRRQVQFLN